MDTGKELVYESSSGKKQSENTHLAIIEAWMAFKKWRLSLRSDYDLRRGLETKLWLTAVNACLGGDDKDRLY